MSFGMRVFNEAGGLVMDTNTFTYQVLGQWTVDFSASTPVNPLTTTLSIPGFDPSTCCLVLLPTRSSDIPTGDTPTNQKCYPHVTVSTGQAVIRSRNPSATAGTYPCAAILRAIAIRYA